MKGRLSPSTRDRALRLVRLATFGGLGGAVGLSGAFSVAAALTFSGKPVAATLRPTPAPPQVPMAANPVQAPPPTPVVVQQVVHQPAAAYSATGSRLASGPRPPAQAPAALGGPAAAAPVGLPAPPPPPPAPVCHSTPSAPC
jgi:hypothetical protein